MKALRGHKVILSTTILIGLFAFLYFFTGVFGDTRIGITLRTNSDLANGLVAHYTFDSSDVSGFDVLDSAGSNNGSIVATTSPGSEVLLDSLAGENTLFLNSGSRIAWTSDQVGYLLYSEPAGGPGQTHMSSTTDGGSTWATPIQITAQDSPEKPTLWYDEWTPGNTSPRYLHIGLLDAADELYYIEYDTSNDTYSETIQVTDGQLGNVISSAGFSITQARDGALYITAPDNTGNVAVRCPSNCTATTSWNVLSDPYGGNGDHLPMLLPVHNTDNVILIFDGDSDQVNMNVYSATSSSWTGVTTLMHSVDDSHGNFGLGLSATYNPKTGTIYVAYINDANDYSTQDHDIRVFTVDPVTFATSSLTDVVTNVSGGIDGVKLVVDTNRDDHLYALYQRRTTISDDTTMNLYHRRSTDGGSTWGSEVGPHNGTEDEMWGIGANIIADEKIAAGFQYETAPNADDAYVVNVVDLGDYEDEKTVFGNIGQGMVFDGRDDYTVLNSTNYLASSTPFTISYWANLDDITAEYPNNSDQFPGVLTLENDQGGSSLFAIFYGTGAYDGVNFGSVSDWARARSNGLPNGIFDRWHHVTITYDATDRLSTDSYTLYLDGELISHTSSGAFASPTVQSRIGNNSTATTYFEGSLDDVRIYNRELSAEEVSRVYGLGATTKVNKTLTTNPGLEDGLIGHWTFDGNDMDWASTTGAALNRAGSGFNGDLTNMADENAVPGILGQALDFNGSNERIQMNLDGELDDLGPLSAAAWIYLESEGTDTYEMVISKSFGVTPLNEGWHIAMDNPSGPNGSIAFKVGHGSADLEIRSVDGTIDLNRWYHVIATWDGGTTATNAHLYIDGEEVSYQEQNNASGGQSGDSANNLFIGRDNASNYWDGKIDDVRLYDRQISAAEAKRLYQLGATTKVNKTLTTNPDLENGLVGHWTFDGPDLDLSSSTAEVEDRSGNGNIGNWLDHATTTTFGRIGQAIDLDGTDDVVSIADSSSLDFNAMTGATVAAWAKYDGTPSGHVLTQWNSTASNRTIDIGLNGGGYSCATNNFNGQADSTTSTSNDWVHIVCVWESSSRLAIYINGVLETTDSSVEATLDANTAPVAIGARSLTSSTFDEYADVTVDDVRIYNRALSDQEILRLYQLGN